VSFDDDKADDFVSLWEKKKKTQQEDTPAFISSSIDELADTESLVLELQKENVELKKKLEMNLQMITQSERAITETVEEKGKTRSIHEQEINAIREELDVVTNEKLELKNIIQRLQEELKSKENNLANQAPLSPAPVNSPVKGALVEELQSELSKKKAQLIIYGNNMRDYDQKFKNFEDQIVELKKEKEDLNSRLVEALKTSSIEIERSALISRPSATSTSQEGALNSLVQDLQSQINKYKNIIKVLNEENSRLEKTLSDGGADALTRDVKTLRKQNEDLKKEISNLNKDVKKKKKDSSKDLSVDENIKMLEKKLEEKERIIDQLKESKPTTSTTPGGLIEDLQDKLNKYKRIVKDLKEENSKLKSGTG
jgi:chromosome segregation ATPase